MMHRFGFLAALVLAAGALSAGMTGCELIASVDRNMIPGAGGAATTGTTGTTSTGGTGGGSGGSQPMCNTGVTACTAVADCPPTMSQCVTAACTAGCCGTSDVAAMTPTATQTPGDCKEVVCDGMGGTQTIDDD